MPTSEKQPDDLGPMLTDERVDASELARLATQAVNISVRWRKRMLEPTEGTRRMRRFSLNEVAHISKIPKSTVKYRIDNGNYPAGRVNPSNGYRSFSLAEIHQIMDLEGTRPSTGPDVSAHTVCCANFKGGSAKSTLSVYLAVYLAIHGYRVLLADLDPQGTTTNVFGWQPDLHVEFENTVMGCFEQGKDLADLAVATHIDGLDMVRATPGMSQAEVFLMQQSRKNGGDYWEALSACMSKAQADYDIIVFDTPPSMSALALNGIYAADGLLIPLPASMIDYESCAVFFRIMSEIVQLFSETEKVEIEKMFDYMRIVITRYSETPANSQMARWIQGTYSPHVLNTYFRNADAILNAAQQTKVLFELRSGKSKEDPEEGDQYDGDPGTFRKTLKMIDQVMSDIESTIATNLEAKRTAGSE
ncbi:AAA family ATPase [Halorhodospira halochloris]|uniref:AAA family ATPase n=1 Tax=Halorhodospira halochloris TaxID=1052 RepID=UPI001EE93AF2|nr:AAA family ATPase [Halorhodospira halochloris]MCG5531332.1 AAA family ATPase [Halorhodospira halochloris]